MCNLDQLITLVLQYAMMIQNNKNIVKNGKKNERLLLWMWISWWTPFFKSYILFISCQNFEYEYKYKKRN